MGVSLPAGNGKQPVPQMNVTPLVDVVLVLLIIFMVVTPLLTKQFWLTLPKKDDSAVVPPNNDQSIVLTVDKAGVLRINRTPIDKAELGPKLTRLLAAKEQKVIFFDADDDAPYGVAVEAMDLARGGGAKSIAILTEKLSP
jgi:biopolymer transport protein TolR